MSDYNDYSDEDIQLELKDRLNYAEILQRSILGLKSALRENPNDITTINALILDLFTDIPDSWYDDENLKDIQGCIDIEFFDARPIFGNQRLSIDYCQNHGIPIVGQKPKINFFKLKKAIINLLDSRDMLIRKKKIEKSTGKNLKYLTLEDLESDLIELEEVGELE